jgi:glucokinase
MTKIPLFMGVDLGRSTRIALVDENGTIISQDRTPTVLTSGRALVNGLIDVTRRIKTSSPSQVIALGIGFPGLIDHRTNRVKVLPNLADVSDIDVRAELSSALGVPIVFDNDANVAAYGEWKCGVAKGAQNVAYITLGTGIGGALILGGKMQRGSRGFSGEFGHIKIGTDDLACSCGSSGCLETVASGPNIVRRTRERFFIDPRFNQSLLASKTSRRLSCEDVVEAAVAGDDLARSVLFETAKYLGIAIANVVNLLNVEKVVMGGPVMGAGEFLLKAIREEAEHHSFGPLFADCSVVAAKMGADAGVIGSAMMARDAIAPTI